MFCTNCGKEIDDNINFCIYCGKPTKSNSGNNQPQAPMKNTKKPKAVKNSNQGKSAAKNNNPSPGPAAQTNNQNNSQANAHQQAQSVQNVQAAPNQPQPNNNQAVNNQAHSPSHAANNHQQPNMQNQPVQQNPSQMGCASLAWKEIRATKGWFLRCMLMSLINLVPIFRFVNTGYLYETAKNAAYGCQQPFPTKIVTSDNFKNGFFMWLVSLIGSLVVGIVFVLLTWLFIATGLIPLAIAFIILDFVIFFIAGMFISLMCQRVSLMSMGSAFNLGKVWNAFKAKFGQLLCLHFVPGFVIGLIQSVFGGIFSAIFFGSSLWALIAAFLKNDINGFISLLFTSLGSYFFVLLVLSFFFGILSFIASSITIRAEGHYVNRHANAWLYEASNQPQAQSVTNGQSIQPNQPQAQPMQTAPQAQGASAPVPVNAAPNNKDPQQVAQPKRVNKPEPKPVPKPAQPAQAPAPQAQAAPAPAPQPQTTQAPANKKHVNKDAEFAKVAQMAQNNEADKGTTVLSVEHDVVTLTDAKGKQHQISSFPATVGKGTKADCQITGDQNISRLHIKIHKYGDDKFVIEDLKSTNKTYLNGFVLEPEELVVLNDGDKIKLGKSEFSVMY